MRLFRRRNATIESLLEKTSLSDKEQTALSEKLTKVVRGEVLEAERRLTKVVAFVPSDSKGKNACYIDQRIGWVERKVFKNYSEYVNDLKKDILIVSCPERRNRYGEN